MKIVVTGATGFLGKALSDKLEELGNSVIRFSSINLNLCGDIELPECDMIFHVGGNSKVYLAKQNPRYDFEVNALGTIKLIEAVRKAGIPKIVYTSSNSVYRDLAVNDENAILGINSYGQFYGLSKLTADMYVKQYAQFYGFEYVIFRPSNFYGPGMSKNVIIDIIRAYLENRDITIGYTFDSKVDFIYIDDLVSAHLLAIDLKNEIFNLSSGVSTKILDVIDIIDSCFDNKINVFEGTNKVKLSISSDKLENLGWKPSTDIQSGILNTVNYFKQIPQS